MARHEFEKYDPATRSYVFDEARAREEFTRGNVVDGVFTWKSNNNFPPEGVLKEWASLGLPFDMKKTLDARDKHYREFDAAYRKRMANYKPSAEEMFEMRAAFGEGATVVNVMTGKRTKL